MRIETIPCLKDNYAYLLIDDTSNEAAIIDPSEAAPVVRAVEQHGVKVRAIYNTHHHPDHVGGNEELAKKYGVEVFGHESDRGRIPAQSQFLRDGDSFEWGALRIRILHIPGHTLGAIAYLVSQSGCPDAVFTGDTMFIAGCGRLFEGTPAQMHTSLSKLGALGEATRVFCGHEYTESNLRFSAHVEPGNREIASAKEKAAKLRAAGKPTVPSTIADEKKVNPFMRVHSTEICQTIGAADPTAAIVFAALRRAKDAFK